MPALILPVNELRCSNGQGLRPQILNERGEVQRQSVEREVDLAIVMLVQLVRVFFQRA